MSDAAQPASNSAYDWSKFDSEAYFQHYYGEPHPDDDLVVRLTVEAFRKAAPRGGFESTVDVGTGPNLFPLFSVMPLAGAMTAWEYAESNVEWLRQELVRRELRSQWRHWWGVAREAYGIDYTLPDNPIPELGRKLSVRQGSIFDLPQRQWDAATMFFCAESITRDHEEFERATAAFCRCVKSGGFLVGAFLVRSGGYVVADRPFPVLSATADEIVAAFSQHATDVETQMIGIVEREIRSGYAGFAFLTGRAK